MRKFYATLSPDEAADVSATFAEQLGKNNMGEFSTAHFLSQTEKFSPEALVTIFGKDGAASIKNLRTLSKASQSVTSAMNSRKSTTGPANYRTWLFDLLLGGAAGAAHGSAGTAATVAAGAAGTTAATQYLSARALMSPKITRWITTAPATASSKAIDAHFERLAEIARAEPALANEIEILRNGIMRAANDNVGLPAAADNEDIPPQPTTPGNLPLEVGPQVKNKDGSISTVRTISIGVPEGEVLIPTVVDGRVVSDEQAIEHFNRTGQNFGTFRSPEEATAYAQWLHRKHEREINR